MGNPAEPTCIESRLPVAARPRCQPHRQNFQRPRTARQSDRQALFSNCSIVIWKFRAEPGR